MAKFTYVDMVCKLDKNKFNDHIDIEGILIEAISNIESDILFDCYTRAFSEGDARFNKLQSKEEQRRYFYQELGFPDVLENPASFAYQGKDEIIGFALVLPYLDRNFHISCMCISPEYQGYGIGKAMLNRIKNIAIENGCKSLTLGTEPEMKAYYLYKSNGFMITGEHLVEM